jgi:hypothetical protein
VAVLLVEDNVDFDRSVASGPGSGLVEALRGRGLTADTVVVPPGGVARVNLSGYGTAIVVDTLVVSPELRAQLEAFVQQGGVLVGIHRVGCQPETEGAGWALGSLFGLRVPSLEDADFQLVGAEPGFYRRAVVDLAESPILQGITNEVDWGALAQSVFVVEAAGAEVVASFSVDGARRLPALTTRKVGGGWAIFISILPPDQQFKGWDKTGDALTVLAQAARLSEAGSEAKALPLELGVGVNALGGTPGWPNRLVLRGQGGQVDQPLVGVYRVLDTNGQEVLRGALSAWTGRLWQCRYATAALTLPETTGLYTLDIQAEGIRTSIAWRVQAPGAVAEELLRGQLACLEALRCGEVCHQDAPVPGGYHRSLVDSTVDLVDMLNLVSALTRLVERNPQDGRLRYELERSVMWCWRMRGEDGLPSVTIRPAGGASAGVSARADQRKREQMKGLSPDQGALFAAVMARAVEPVREHISQNLAREIASLAEYLYGRFRKTEPQTTAEVGNRLWAALELSRMSEQALYLEDARQLVVRLYGRQLGVGLVPGSAVSGELYNDGEKASFSPLQYERDRGVGLYRGLVELYRELPSGTEKGDAKALVDRLVRGFLQGTAALSPYGQVASGLEPAAPPRPRPGNRGGFEPPDRFHVRWFRPRNLAGEERGANRELLILAGLALDWSQETEDVALRELALSQLEWILGVNFQGRLQLDEAGAVQNGFLGRANQPVWGDGSSGRGGLAEGVALLNMLAGWPIGL